MDVRRSPGKRSYPEVVYLLSWATAPQIWHFFDGWCTAQGLDHESLPWDRWLNLVYYFAVRNASEESKKEFDAAMSQAVSAWNLARVQPLLEQSRRTEKESPVPKQQRERRLPPKPAGWGDDARATFDNKAAAKTLTAGGVSGRKRQK